MFCKNNSGVPHVLVVPVFKYRCKECVAYKNFVRQSPA